MYSHKVYETTNTQVNWNSVTNTQTPLGTKKSAEFGQVLINNKEKLLKDLPIKETEFTNLVKASRIVAWKESNMAANPKRKSVDIASDLREAFSSPEEIQ